MSRPGARLLVFSTSAAVLVLEILAGRLLAPFVGVTLETFTGIIGTVLAGISLGSWLGGRAADRHPPRRLLGPLLVAGGILTLLAPTIVAAAGPGLRGGEPLGIVVLTALGFFAPALVLSAVNPVVVKIQLNDLGETGSVVGQLSAVGTAGAIFGTFATGFVLLAAWPSRPIVLVVGAALVTAGIWLTAGAARPVPPALAAVIAGALAAGSLNLVVGGPCQVETTYFCAKVTIDDFRPGGRVLWLDTLRHSYVDLDDPTHLEFRYAGLVAAAVDTQAPAGPLDALYIGGGGFTLPRWLSAVRPGSTNTVLELDPELVEIAERQLGLDPAEIDRIEVGDARLTIDDTPDDAFELVVGDAFGGESVPWHLTTRQFYEVVRLKMAGDGVYAMNLIDYPPLGFARAEAATLRDVFRHVMVVAPPDYLAGERGGNFVLVASERQLDLRAMAAALTGRATGEIAISGEDVDVWIDGARVLTDDFAPVDQLISHP